MIEETNSSGRHPFLSLLSLLMWFIMGMVVSSVVAVIVCGLIFSPRSLSSFDMSFLSQTESLRLFQLVSSLGTFVFPALLFARQQSNNAFVYLKLNTPLPLHMLALAIIIYFVSTPFIEWTIVENSQMKLPGFLKFIEDWMRQKEDEMAGLTKQLLLMKSPGDLFINLLVIAVIPGIGEELIFRGCLQRIFTYWTKNYHLGIWLAAITFSAIHVQFYGFIPRMLLGALFGYLFYWGRNLAIPMIVHSLNNGSAVVSAYYLQQKGASLDSLDKPEEYPAYAALLSLILGVGLVLLYRKLAVARETDEQRLG